MLIKKKEVSLRKKNLRTVETLNSKFQLPDKREETRGGESWRVKLSMKTASCRAESALRTKTETWRKDAGHTCACAQWEGALDLLVFRLVSLRTWAPSWRWRNGGCFQDLLPALITALQGGTWRDGVRWDQLASQKSQGLERMMGNWATGQEKVWEKSRKC